MSKQAEMTRRPGGVPISLRVRVRANVNLTTKEDRGAERVYARECFVAARLAAD